MCEELPPERREVEGKGEGEALVGWWDWGVVKGEKDDMAERGVPSTADKGVSRVAILKDKVAEANFAARFLGSSISKT